MDRKKAKKVDPIRDRYFRPLQRAEKWADVLFYVAAALSIIVVLIGKAEHQRVYQLVQIGFLLSAVAGFVVGLAIRLYWSPRAQDRRRMDLLSNAFGTPITHERTSGYYNNEQENSIRKLGAQILENSIHSKETALEMCRDERIRLFSYVAIWLLAVFYRNTPIDLIVAVSQALFGEQIISRWVRLEWLRIQFERIQGAVYRLFQATPAETAFHAMILDEIIAYEAAKANAGITLSSKIFERNNERVSAEWGTVKKELGL
jgi:hypothetical protein